MGELSKLPNIGNVLEKQLNDVNRLMAFEGAIQNIRWHSLSEEDKDDLRNFYNSQK